jgi:hypothetical protein
LFNLTSNARQIRLAHYVQDAANLFFLVFKILEDCLLAFHSRQLEHGAGRRPKLVPINFAFLSRRGVDNSAFRCHRVNFTIRTIVLYSLMMTYDEFSNKLQEIKAEFEKAKGSKLVMVKQLEDYLIERKNRRQSKGLKSLKGLSV